MKKLLVILGSTSTGKTDLALQLARKFQGELVSVDSRQVYAGLDIGTGKLPGGKCQIKKANGYWQINGMRVWMYDVADLKRQYSVADYVKDASRVIDKILKRGKLPIVVGGTGLYLTALLQGLSNLVIPINHQLREQLNNFTIDELQKKLQQLSKKKWQGLNQSDQQNPRRLVRAIEILSMYPYKKTIKSKDPRIENVDTLKIGLTAPKDILYENINSRVKQWIEEGIIDEVKNLITSGISKNRIKELGLEYKVIVEYLEGNISINETIEKMKVKIRQYAKRQITWFKKEQDISWFDITNQDYLAEIENLVAKWYDTKTI